MTNELHRLADALPDLSTRVAWRSPWHGPRHWRDVARVGLLLTGGVSPTTRPGDRRIVLLFAMLHDTQRRSEDHDPQHGDRAADLVIGMLAPGGLLDWLPASDAGRLIRALRGHDRGAVAGDPGIGTCWDADRLTLPRVGTRVDTTYLSTDRAAWPTTMAAAEHMVRSRRALDWSRLINAYERNT